MTNDDINAMIRAHLVLFDNNFVYVKKKIQFNIIKKMTVGMLIITSRFRS